MYNPNNSRGLDGLAADVRWSRRMMEPFRRNVYDMACSIVGARYSWTAAAKPQPVNLLSLAYHIFKRLLVSRAPRAMVSTLNPNFMPLAKDMQAWLDRAAQGLHLLESLRLCVGDALLSMGMMKIGEEAIGETTINDVTHLYGQPYAVPVSFPDDAVIDMQATRIETMKFSGNRWFASLEEAKEDKTFKKSAREALQASHQRIYNEMGDPRLQTLSQGTFTPYDAYDDMVELWDIWLPREKLLITLPYMESADGSIYTGDEALRVVEWSEPREGPYRFLSLSEISNNVLPPAPLQTLVDLSDNVNSMFRKLLRQARRQKKVHVFGGAAAKDMEAFNQSSDGQAVKGDWLKSKDMVIEVSSGGIDQATYLFAEQCRLLFSWLAGNLDTQGGLSPQAGTLGQEELLAGASSKQVAEWQDRTWNFSENVVKDCARHWWKNPILWYETSREAATGDQVPVSITPQMRQIPFDRFDWRIDMFSMQHRTPQTMLAGIMQTLTQIYGPFMGAMQQQGFFLDFQALNEAIQRYQDIPDLARIVKRGPPPQMQGAMQIAQGAAEEARQSPVTQRTNVRVNRPGMTMRGHSQNMQQMLATAQQQPQNGVRSPIPMG